MGLLHVEGQQVGLHLLVAYLQVKLQFQVQVKKKAKNTLHPTISSTLGRIGRRFGFGPCTTLGLLSLWLISNTPGLDMLLGVTGVMTRPALCATDCNIDLGAMLTFFLRCIVKSSPILSLKKSTTGDSSKLQIDFYHRRPRE